MIYLLLIFLCPFLGVLLLVYFINILYFIAFIMPGIIVCSLLFVWGTELKSPLLIWLSFIFSIVWFIYVMKKIDYLICGKIDKK